jgi:hypothetical protein
MITPFAVAAPNQLTVPVGIEGFVPTMVDSYSVCDCMSWAPMLPA